jgi:ABC-type spermidine/putrescine transport system permease subunit II
MIPLTAKRGYDIYHILLWTYVAAFYGFLYAPLTVNFILSFNDSTIYGFPIRDFTTKWYAVAASNTRLVEAVKNSLSVGALAAALATAMSLSLALAFRHEFRGKSLILNLVMIPVVVPGIVGAIVLLMLFGFLNVQPSLYTTVLVGHLNWVLPVAFFTIYPRVHNFDKALEEAASDLGARASRVFWYVVLPIVRPGIIATFLFSFSLSFDEFIRTLFLTGHQTTVPVQFYGMIIDNVAPELPAMAVIITGISIALAAIAFAYSAAGARQDAS